MKFEDLIKRWNWQAIPNCPGRYVLRGEPVDFSDLIGPGTTAQPFETTTARDPVVVVPLEGGAGLISYKKRGGKYIHTLNTSEGFERKLRQLGIKR